MNLIYYVLVRNLDEDQRRELDRGLAPVTQPEVLLPSGLKRRAPSWWKGDQGAATSSITAARQLGFGVGQVDVARTG